MVPHQQESLDQFVHALRWRLLSSVPRFAVLDTGNQAVARRLDDANSGLRDERHCRVRRRLVRVWSGLHLDRKRSKWDRHSVARRRPGASRNAGCKPRQRCADIRRGLGFVLLALALAALAQESLSQGLRLIMVSV